MPAPPPDVQTLFLQAVELEDPADRAALLGERCAGRPALRAEVEALLTSHRKPSGPLDRPAAARATAPSDRTAALHFSATVVGNPDAAGPLPGRERTIDEARDAPPEFGRKLGGYDILETVGRGGMGVVLKARDPHLDRIVAIKALAPELAADPTARRRFAREARAAAAVTHPHVVTIHAVEPGGAGPDGPAPFLVMEYVAGRSLKEKLEADGALEVREALRIGSQIAVGLAAAHAQGLIHRDVKPGNVLLENGVERVKLTDFGLARAADDVAITRTGEIAGTPQFMSPEQAEGLPVDARSDLFSLGAVLYAMCTGRPPFRGESTMTILRKVCDATPRPIREVNPDVPPWLTAIVDRLLAKAPAERFDSAAEVAALLSSRLAELQNPNAAERPRPAVAPSRPSAAGGRRGRRWAIAAAALAAVLLVGGTTEATGVTEVIPTVVRLVRGDGTLVIRTDDPHVGVTIEGEDVVLTGTGLSEIRLKPGTYTVKATKDGRPAFTELVTVARNGREVVNVQWEPGGSARTTVGPQAIAAAATDGPPPLTLLRSFEGHDDAVHGLAVLPDGARAFSVGADGRVRLWSLSDGRSLWTFETPPNKLGARGVAISPDGTTVAVGDGAGFVFLLDAETGKETRRWRARNEGVPALSFSPDGERLAVVGWAGSDLHIWNLSDLSEVALPPATKGAMAVAWSPDGRQILAGGEKLYRYDAVSGTLLGAHDPGRATVNSVAFSPDGRRLAGGRSDGVVVLLDRGGSGSQAFRGHADDVDALAFTPDGRRLLSGSRDRTLRVWDVKTGAEVARQAAPNQVFHRIAATPDGRAVLTAGGWTYDAARGGDVGDGDYALRLWRLPERGVGANDADAFPLVRTLSGHASSVNGIAVYDDGRRAVSVSEEKRIRVWNLETGALLKTIETGEGMKAVAVTPDGRQAIVGGLSSPAAELRWYDLDSGDLVRKSFRLGGASDHLITGLSLTPDGSQVVASRLRGGPALFDAATAELIRKFAPPSRMATAGPDVGSNCLALSPDGTQLATGWHSSGRDGELVVWNLESGEVVFQQDVGARATAALAFSPDGRRLLAGDNGGHLTLCDVPGDAVLRRFRAHDPVGVLGVNSVSFLPDGRALSAGFDGTVRLWDLTATGAETPEELARLERPDQTLLNLTLLPGGERFLTGGGGFWNGEAVEKTGDYALRLWDLTSDQPANPGDAAAPDRLVELTEQKLTRVRRMFEMGDADLLEVRRVSRQLLGAKFRRAEARGRRGEAAEQLRLTIENLKQLVEATQARIEAGELPLADLQDAEQELLETEIRLREYRRTYGLPEPTAAAAPVALTEDVRIEALSEFVLALGYTPDGRALVTGGADGAIVWDARNGRRKQELAGHDGRSVHAAVVLPDGQRAVSAGKGDAILLSDLNTGEVIRRFEGHTGFVECLAVSLDGTRIASGSSNWVRKDRGDLTVRVWDADSGEELWRAEPPPTGNGYGAVHQVMFTPDGGRVISVHHAAEDGISVWDAATGALQRRFSGPHSSIKSAALSPDGRTLATGHEAVQVKELRWDDPEHAVVLLWDLESGEELRRLVGHAGQINAVAFSPDGTRLLSCSGSQYLNDAWKPELSRDNSVRLWDVATGAELARQQLPGGGQAAAYAPNGEHVASVAGGQNLVVQIWRVPDSVSAAVVR